MTESNSINSNPLYYIGVIGSRGDIINENLFYTKEQYYSMVNKTKEYIESLGYENSDICLVSGGSSFSDHIIITLFNEASFEMNPFHSLIIYSPCKWDSVNKQFDSINSKNKTAFQLNNLHDTFSKRLSVNTLEEIDKIQKQYPNNVIFDDTSNSYFQRDKKIADTCKDVLIAFWWRESFNSVPMNSGTKSTWRLAKNTSIKEYFSILNIDENLKSDTNSDSNIDSNSNSNTNSNTNSNINNKNNNKDDKSKNENYNNNENDIESENSYFRDDPLLENYILKCKF